VHDLTKVDIERSPGAANGAAADHQDQTGFETGMSNVHKKKTAPRE